jgi:hypothetical protein
MPALKPLFSPLEPLFSVLDAANELAADLPAISVRTVTVRVPAARLNEVRRYLKARTFADGAVIGSYGDLEVRVEVTP